MRGEEKKNSFWLYQAFKFILSRCTGGGVRACVHNETTPPPDRLPVRFRRRRRHRRRQRRRGRRRSTTVKHKVSGRVQGVHVAVIRRRRRRRCHHSRNHRRHRLVFRSFSRLPTPLVVVRCTRDTRSHRPTASCDFLDPATGIRRAPNTHRLVSFRSHMVRRSTIYHPPGHVHARRR